MKCFLKRLKYVWKISAGGGESQALGWSGANEKGT